MSHAAEHRLIIDRVEGSVAVVDIDGVMFDLPRWMLPTGAKEGTVLVATLDEGDGESWVLLRVDAAATAAAQAKVESALLRLRRGDNEGDIAL